MQQFLLTTLRSGPNDHTDAYTDDDLLYALLHFAGWLPYLLRFLYTCTGDDFLYTLLHFAGWVQYLLMLLCTGS